MASTHTVETIAYFKFWLGVLVFVDISLMGWLVAQVDGASIDAVVRLGVWEWAQMWLDIIKAGAILLIVGLSLVAFTLHSRIRNYLSTLGGGR